MQVNNVTPKIGSMTSGLIALLILFVSNLAAAQSQVEPLDRVVAVVDNMIVAQSELDLRMKDVVNRVQQSGMQLPPRDILQKQILDQLISETLQLGLAERYGVQVSDAEVNNYTANIMQSNGWDEASFLQSLATDGLTENEFRENIRRQMTMQSISQGLVSRRIRVSEQEIDNFLSSADAQVWASPDFHLGHILIALPSSPSSEAIIAAEEKANALYEKLSNGANFAESAIAQSSGPAALEGGDLGWRKSSQLPTLFAEVANKLKVDEVSKPTRSQAGFHLLKLYEKREPNRQIVNQTKARHILIKTSEIVDDQLAISRLEDIRQQILDGGDFDKLAKQHSEDIGSRMSGGDLGWAGPGMFTPAFEKTMNDTAVDEVSKPFKSDFGWHILQVTGRRAEDLTEEAMRGRAQNMLMSRRFEDEMQVWLQELRDEAYIEIKI